MVVSRCGGVGRHWRLYASWLVGGGEEGGERYFFCGDVWELFFWHACFVSRWWAAGLVRCSSIVSILGASAVCLASSSPSLPYFFFVLACVACAPLLFSCVPCTLCSQRGALSYSVPGWTRMSFQLTWFRVLMGVRSRAVMRGPRQEYHAVASLMRSWCGPLLPRRVAADEEE